MIIGKPYSSLEYYARSIFSQSASSNPYGALSNVPYNKLVYGLEISLRIEGTFSLSPGIKIWCFRPNTGFPLPDHIRKGYLFGGKSHMSFILPGVRLLNKWYFRYLDWKRR